MRSGCTRHPTTLLHSGPARGWLHLRPATTMQARASAQPANAPPPLRLLGMGSVGLDMLAAVATFPTPDDKLRTERFEVNA